MLIVDNADLVHSVACNVSMDNAERCVHQQHGNATNKSDSIQAPK